MAGAGEVVSLQEARVTKELSHFTGTYIVGTRSNPNDAIMIIENGELIQWYSCGNIACTSFHLDLKNFGREVEEPYNGPRGKAVRQTKSGWQNDGVFFEQITTDGRNREIERREIQLYGDVLTLKVKRDYYRRRFWSDYWEKTFHPAPPDSALSIMSQTLYMVKISDETVSSEAFREMLRKRPSTYLRLKAPAGGTGTETVRELIRDGHYEMVNDNAIKPEAKILKFPSSCEKDL